MNVRLLKDTHYIIESAKIPKEFNGFKIIQLSDLHGRVFTHQYKQIIDMLKKLNPDIVVLTGDMVDNRLKYSVANVEILCKLISQAYRTYFIFGNHEQALQTNKLKDFSCGLEKLGIKILKNKRCIIKRGSAEIVLNGLITPMRFYNDPFHEYQKRTVLDVRGMRKLLGNIDDRHYNILLAHNPIFFEAYCEWGADLTLAGHIHGGIIDIPGVGGLLSPDVTFFPKYYAGQYEINEKKMIVSRGLSNRFLASITNPSEIVFVTLKSKQEN